jgi:hypothetical protein
MHTAIRIRYPDIREDLSEKVSEYSISDGYQTYCIRIRYPNKISVFVSVIRKKSGYPKIPSEPVFTIFESGSGRIFSEPYYIPSFRPQRMRLNLILLFYWRMLPKNTKPQKCTTRKRNNKRKQSKNDLQLLFFANWVSQVRTWVYRRI